MSHTTTEELNALKNELLGTVSHELRTPLAAISGNAALLLQQGTPLPPAEQRECLNEIAQAAHRLTTAITLLLDVADYTADTVTVAQRPVDVAHLARDALSTAEAGAMAEDRPLRFVAPTDTEACWVRGDADWLRKALDQLLLNARQCTPAGGTITVALRPCRVADGAGIELTVQDTGCGIAPKHLPHLFERFYRVDTRLNREVNGLGLGLALCHQIARAHGGTLSVASTVGVGSIFHLCLPAWAASIA